MNGEVCCSFKACINASKFDIIYDCGLSDQALKLCGEHYNSHDVFQKYIKIIREVSNDQT